uniref:Adhesion G-protein coupled receptor G6 n=1 Tax=Periophthalmus magnuspinnatus TaxID=409849 RepID=A0A3B3ZYC2_9GOBI
MSPPPVLSCVAPDCNLALQGTHGAMKSPCYPQKYPNSHTCRWTIQAPTGHIVQLTFVDFELEEAPGCIYDWVIVNTGQTDVRFCGLTARGLSLNSTGNLIVLSFNSDFSVQKRGFYVEYRHVAVDMRNQKITVNSGNGQVTKVSSSVSMPTLSHLTVCFEAQRISLKQKEWLFTYYDSSSNVALSFGADREEMKVIVDGQECSVNSLITQANLTSTMTPVCVVWTSANGKVVLYYNNRYLSTSCSALSGRSVPAGGLFQLGGKNGSIRSQHSFEGFIYNLRLWDYSMSQQQLSALTCDTEGNVIDWDNSYWNVPSTLAQTDASLSCSEYNQPGGITAISTCISLYLCILQLNQTFQNWTHSVYVGFIRLVLSFVSCGISFNYMCCMKTMYLSNIMYLLQFCSVSLCVVHYSYTPISTSYCMFLYMCLGNCPEEVSVHYRWPESRPTVSHTLPCFPNKDSSTSRTCLISPQNFTSHWSTPDTSNCTVINNIQVSAGNNRQPITLVVKVKELVNVAKINTSLAHTVVTIISNVMKRPETTRPATSLKALKAVDKLAQKIEFEGDTVSITSKHLAVGVSSLNTTIFKGTRFSAFIGPNSSQPEIDFVSKRANPLAQVILPASLLTNISLTEAERTSLSRINFMFFSSTNLFQKEQDGLSLNSYVVASSVGNFTISNLKDPVRIEIAHLTEQPPVCMFWDFTMKEGDGGWNRKGCRISPDSTSNKSVCLCNHLTHFGILMDIYGSSAYINEQNTKILTFITYIGCGISAVFSAVTLLTYIAFEKLRRDYPSKILMNLSTSLLCLNLTFLLDGWLASLSSDWLCVTVAVFLHYFLLTSFTWMGLESIHMYIALVKVFNTYIRRYILKFCLVGWGLPAVIVGIVAAIDKNSYGLQEYGRGARGSSEFCWIKNQVVFYVTCVGYFCLIFLLNVAMFIVVMLQICGRNGKRSNRTLREEVLRNLRSVISLTFLLGMTWGFALFAWGPVNLAFMYLFSIFNSLQGLFIFIFHCALKENVQKQWRRYLCCGRFRLSDNSDWSKTATNNTKKVSSENLGKSLSSSSFGSSTANWTSKAKATLNPFTKRHSNTGRTAHRVGRLGMLSQFLSS